VNEKITELAEKVNSYMQTVIYTKVIGWMIKLMVMVSISTLTTLFTKANGKMTNNMDMEKNLGQIEVSMKANM